MQIINFLKGKKTYIVGALTIILGLLNGDTTMVMAGIGMITMRAGMTNAIAGAVRAGALRV